MAQPQGDWSRPRHARRRPSGSHAPLARVCLNAVQTGRRRARHAGGHCAPVRRPGDGHHPGRGGDSSPSPLRRDVVSELAASSSSAGHPGAGAGDAIGATVHLVEALARSWRLHEDAVLGRVNGAKTSFSPTRWAVWPRLRRSPVSHTPPPASWAPRMHGSVHPRSPRPMPSSATRHPRLVSRPPPGRTRGAGALDTRLRRRGRRACRSAHAIALGREVGGDRPTRGGADRGTLAGCWRTRPGSRADPP